MNKLQRYADHAAHPLNAEIERLYIRKAELETELYTNWEYLKSNYTSIAVRSVIRKTSYGATIIKALVNISKMQEIAGRMAIKTFSWLGRLINKWFDKVAE